MQTNSSNLHIPELGQVLKFLLDCFDIRRDGDPLTHKQVERLAKGKDLSREKLEKVSRAILDTIYKQVAAATTAGEPTGRVMDEWSRNPGSMQGLAYNEKGEVVLTRDQLLKDLVEFCWRHQFLIEHLKDCKHTSGAMQYWLSGFVIPYVASNLVDYYFTANNPEAGMPGGRLWYVPQIEATQDPARPHRLVMPSQQVLRWWEDLLGRSLENLGKQLCGPASDPESARRQIAAWKNEAKSPDSETIRRWTNQTWDYQGVFHDDPALPIQERWRRCREFLNGKDLIGNSDWTKGTKNSEFDPERALAESYRGERLEEEICPFAAHPFKDFFDSSDPKADGLPVEKLVERVAARWRTPTRVELHSRLMVGRAMNIAWNACTRALGMEGTLKSIRWAGCSYNHYMTLCEKSEKLSAQESMRIHCQTVERADPGFYPLAAMLDEGHWLGLPAYLRRWIKGEVVFKD
jgi:hypothetical protein